RLQNASPPQAVDEFQGIKRNKNHRGTPLSIPFSMGPAERRVNEGGFPLDRTPPSPDPRRRADKSQTKTSPPIKSMGRAAGTSP
ncbi:MAG: hypothetical protein FD153_2031, partial [Rhodospirillaceae bacterium]